MDDIIDKRPDLWPGTIGHKGQVWREKDQNAQPDRKARAKVGIIDQGRCKDDQPLDPLPHNRVVHTDDPTKLWETMPRWARGRKKVNKCQRAKSILRDRGGLLWLPMSYSFRRATEHDLALLCEWQRRPHVLEWWGEDEPFEKADLSDPRVARWIVTHNDTPFAYIQDYDVHGWEGHYFANLAPGARGIDQFIGESAMVGIGHGTAFMREHVGRLFDQGAPVVATDPHPENHHAIGAYRKVGFRAVGPPKATSWGLILPMTVEPPKFQTSADRL